MYVRRMALIGTLVCGIDTLLSVMIKARERKHPERPQHFTCAA